MEMINRPKNWCFLRIWVPFYLLQYFCLENSMDGEAWQVPVHGVATSQKQLSHDVSLTHSLSYFNLYEFMFLAFFIKWFIWVKTNRAKRDCLNQHCKNLCINQCFNSFFAQIICSEVGRLDLISLVTISLFFLFVRQHAGWYRVCVASPLRTGLMGLLLSSWRSNTYRKFCLSDSYSKFIFHLDNVSLNSMIIFPLPSG